MRSQTAVLAIMLSTFLALSVLVMPIRASTTHGPRIDELLIKTYDSEVAEFDAFEAGEIDLVDWPFGGSEVERWSTAPYKETIALDPYREIGMFEFDINNNLTMQSYPNWPSPTSYSEFRHAMAHLVDKYFIIQSYVEYGSKLEAPIMPWLRWYDPAMPIHSYDPVEACRILHDAGWRDSADPNVVEDVHFPPGHPLAGQKLKDAMANGPHGTNDPGLIFYRRADDTRRSQAASLLIAGDATHLGLQNIGIPVDDNNVPRSISSPVVMYRKNFHIYTGGWSLSRDPSYLYDLWSSRSPYMNWNCEAFAWNYGNINDPDWDTAITNVKFAENPDTAEYWSHQACQIFGNKVFFIPIWTTTAHLAHKRPWHALNVESHGVRHWWNLECIHNPDIGLTGGQLRWGFRSDVELLNIMYSQLAQDWQILDKIFSTLVTFNPLNIGVDMPGMASGWTFGTWTNPDTGRTASKISFTLRSDIEWINPLTGTVNSAVTPEDVKFSYQYVYDQVGWNYASSADLYLNPDGTQKVEISGNTLTFYESIQSVWAFHWLGGLPIIPKSVFEPIADPHGFYPGGVYPQTLMGSGNFYFSAYTAGVSALLTANRNYYMSIVPDIDTNPSTIKIEWGIFRSNVKDGDWTVNVLDLIIVAKVLSWTGKQGDIPQDINKDGKVNVLDLIIVATNIGATW